MMQFEWDEEKAEGNLKKHGVSFAEAKAVWDDYFYVDLFDDEHSIDENRFLLIGESAGKKLLIISYTERENKIRIIKCQRINSEGKKRI